MDTLAQLLMEKGLIKEDEFYWKLKEVQMEYEGKGKVIVGCICISEPSGLLFSSLRT